ncbi:MAG: hypothetical protein ABIQ40_12815 [Bacteroidia bacterium]
MKKLALATAIFSLMLGGTMSAQESNGGESFGNTLNLGIGIGYYGYIGGALPVVHADYEFNVAPNFTLAPFITVYSYKRYYRWGDNNNPYRDYYYRQTVIPIGVKGSYYFDELLGAGPRWDFYLGASLGFAIRKTTWENGYYGQYVVSHSSSGLYLDGHIGTEFHMNDNVGLFLDLSSGISTLGLAVHF